MLRIISSAFGVFVLSVVAIFLTKMLSAGTDKATGVGVLRAFDGPMFCMIGVLYLAAGMCMMFLVSAR
jgi:hypothetical protein